MQFLFFTYSMVRRTVPGRHAAVTDRRLVAMRIFLIAFVLICLPARGLAQVGLGLPSTGGGNASSLLTDPTDSPGLHFLFDLDKQCSRETETGGGAAFAAWFADHAVSIANNKPPVQGHDAIAAQAQWKASDYQLSWVPDGGEMAPCGTMGYTWGHYAGHSKDAEGGPIVTTGRYMEVWEKQPNGLWKIVLNASNEGPVLECCKLP